MKILFIYPSEERLIDTGLPSILEQGAGFSPPLGILYLAANVKCHTLWQAQVMDCVAERLNYERIHERIKEARPDVIAVTVMTHQLLDCLEIAKIAKRINDKIRVVFGGPHAHIYPKETLAFNVVDHVIAGEAEGSLVEFLNVWEDPGKFNAIPGLHSKVSRAVVSGPPPVPVDDLDLLPHPARELLKYKLYNSPLAQAETVATMITSRGCPFKCVFCDRPLLGKKFRARSARDVVDEMQECLAMGIGYIKIYDDTFTVDRGRVFAVCAEIKKRGLKINFDIRAHIGTVDLEMLKALKGSGCRLICYGVESGNNEILKKLKKGITKEKAIEVFGLTRRAGIKTLAYFMFGSPGETREQMLETISFAKRLNPDFCHFTILVPFPCTPIYAEGLEKGTLTRDYWLDFARNPTVDFKPGMWTENVSAQDLKALLIKAYREFYLRPSYIMKRFLEIRSLNDLKRKFRSGTCLLRNN